MTGTVHGLLLAGGAGRRMGGPKALLRDRRGVPFLFATGPGAEIQRPLAGVVIAIVGPLLSILLPAIGPAVAACWALGISWAVEFLQLTEIPAQLSAAVPLTRLVVGTTYNALDLVAYVVGAAAAYLVHRMFATRIR